MFFTIASTWINSQGCPKEGMFLTLCCSKFCEGYSPLKCIDPQMAALIYPHFLAAHGCYPNNDQIPLYFSWQFYVEVHLGRVVNYTDLPGHLGWGHGSLDNRQLSCLSLTHRLIVRERVPTISPMLGPLTDEAMHSTQLHGVIQ